MQVSSSIVLYSLQGLIFKVKQYYPIFHACLTKDYRTRQGRAKTTACDIIGNYMLDLLAMTRMEAKEPQPSHSGSATTWLQELHHSSILLCSVTRSEDPCLIGYILTHCALVYAVCIIFCGC